MRIPRAKDNVSQAIIADRLSVIRDLGVDLPHTTHYAFDPACTTGNIENFIGVAQVPLGLAGPIRIHGEHAQGDFIVPLATSEGTLVASYSRGMKAISEAGGCVTRILSDFFMVPYLFRILSLEDGMRFAAWCETHVREIAEAMEATTRHGEFHGMRTRHVAQGVVLEFEMRTGDAMGANMAVVAAHAASQWITENAPNMEPKNCHLVDMGKKAVASRAMRGFGKNVTAEVRLTENVLQEVFHTTATDWISLYRAVQEYWSTTGTHGHQCMFANGLAALFIACGQDVGYLPEASYGYLLPSALPDGGLHVTIQIPCLVVGTVGGGCGLPTQKESLRILGCDGPGGARKLAEIAAGVALAGELSVLGSSAAKEFVSAHETLGRKRPKSGTDEGTPK
jgi:hydroxymethylglutaryl-CoA reductase (NADPH)